MTPTTKHAGLISQIQAGAVPVSTLTGVILAALLGVFLVLGTGLAGADVLHNAAHDSRHGIGFPCH